MEQEKVEFKRPPRPKMDFAVLGRVMGYIFKSYKFKLALVIPASNKSFLTTSIVNLVA